MAVRIIVPFALDSTGAAMRHYVYGSYFKKLIHYGLLPIMVSPICRGAQLIAVESGGTLHQHESSDPKQFLFGIQAHPEADRQFTLEPLIKAFAQAARDSGSKQ